MRKMTRIPNTPSRAPQTSAPSDTIKHLGAGLVLRRVLLLRKNNNFTILHLKRQICSRCVYFKKYHYLSINPSSLGVKIGKSDVLYLIVVSQYGSIDHMSYL